ncbi:MAG TPA: SCO family protein [Pyrinomonadaceae bacterium]|nr:SCO family protein [Pyrinomonadaceae bacterium]
MRDNIRSNVLKTGRALAGLLLVFTAGAVGFAQTTPQRAATPPGATHAAEAHAKEDATFECPMHPSVKATAPGKCPKCGMALRRPERTTRPVAVPAAAMGTRADGRPSTIPDLELLDQDGKTVRFYSDLVKGKTVAINFIFTTCTTICPPLGATFARVQKELGPRAGSDVHFISVSVDPATDTPERLKAWGAKFKAGPGWTFVTGDKASVDQLLNALAASASKREDHSPTVVVINDAKNVVTRTYGLARPSQLIKVIDEAIAGGSPVASGSKE